MRHRFHALCPYFAMFPESFAEKWIDRLSKPHQLILDPFCGRGTAPFQALLMERRAIGCDINPVAYCITKAKTNAPRLADVRRRITLLERGFNPHDWETARRRLPVFFQHAYSPVTLRQVLYLRSRLRWLESDADCMIAALALGALHGESNRSPSYLSNQMPRTISTKPDYSVRYWQTNGFTAPKRDAFALLRRLLRFRYESDPPAERALVYQLDMRELPRSLKRAVTTPIRYVITSPPYLDVTSFEEDQWLRLWFLGGEPNPTYRKVSRDDRHERPADYWNMISDLWRMLGQVLGRRSHIVVRLGGKNLQPDQIARGLMATSVFSRRTVEMVDDYEVSAIRKRQTDAFRPGSKGCSVEVDCHFYML